MTDYLIVGAGPAGISAALAAVELGVTPDVVDNRPEPGGNIYAFLNSTRNQRAGMLPKFGSAYSGGLPLIDRFLGAVSDNKIRYWPRTKLWHLDQDHTFSISGPTRNLSGKAKQVCLATGAQERPVPVPGWTLPGVMGVGAAQIMLKSGGQLPDGPMVMIGTGPLPLLLATQIRKIGRNISAFIEPKGAQKLLLSPQAYLGSLAAPATAIKGVSYLLSQKLSATSTYSGVTNIEVLGEDKASHVRFTCKNETVEIEAGLVLVHDGIIPNANPIGAAGIKTHYDPLQQTFKVSTENSIKVAGDAGGILGAQAAEISGRMATLSAFEKPTSIRLRFGLWRQKKFRRFLDEAYPPVKFAPKASPNTTICRCELATAQQIRDVANINGPDANRIKTTLRCGMGPCQGRMCGSSINDLIHDETGTPFSEITTQRYRSPILPVTFGELTEDISE